MTPATSRKCQAGPMAMDDGSHHSSERQIAELKRRLNRLPTKGFFVATMIAVDVAIAAIITFGEKLQALVR